MENFLIDDDVYGQVFVLGYNGSESVSYSQNGSSSMISTRSVLRRKPQPNGVIPSSKHYMVTDPTSSASLRDRRHFIAYVKSRTETLIQEYQNDPFSDMFQVGRSTDKPIDVTVKDTRCSDLDTDEVSADHQAAAADKDQHRDSTISRFACRLLVNRTLPYQPRVFAAGFDNHRNICLGEKAPKWATESGMDGLTTNGVLVFHPPAWGAIGEDAPGWLEVSVRGAMLSLRSSRSAKQRGQPLVSDSNVLRDGSLIDLCGVTLLYRTKEGLDQSPTSRELDDRLACLNADRPQCPVGMNTLVIPRQRTHMALKASDQPYIYMTCGHVQGRHGWGDQPNKLKKCPICFKDGSIVRMCMGMEAAFIVGQDSTPTHAFNPCGHMASLKTVDYWSRIPFPHQATAYKPSSPACPFCITLLDAKCPYVRVIFP
ncbi:Protein pellino [Hypsibius exemplaris]|uniref:Protein pellino n=1 Tax=Hypsibius exemplaris TaxID=2072580 RepID=A0A1W0WU73_HYPEX|nr:Protein pellino [Hypsibius exemplaris]